MTYDVDVALLSPQFERDYPAARFPELLQKPGRPYTCLLIDSHEDYLICVPFRSSIEHKNAFLFRGTKRSASTKSGLDYSKIVLIQDSMYIDQARQAVVDQDEYNEMMKSLPTILSDVDQYIFNLCGTYQRRQYIAPRNLSPEVSVFHAAIFSRYFKIRRR